MGEVHEAYDTVRERIIALKRFAPDNPHAPGLQERFRRESRIAARLDSPHAVPIHDFGMIEGRLYIDMRLVRGGDLGARLAAEGPMNADRAVTVVSQLADALDTAHAAGLVHRDVKPSNALLTSKSGQDFAYLTDFGIVHVLDPTSAERLTVTGAFLGTPTYMAPEQLIGKGFDRRLDVYALACLLVTALTGRPPFVGDQLSVMYQHLHSTPPPLSSRRSDLPPALDAVVASALAKRPEERPPSAGVLADAMRRALGTASPAAPALHFTASSPTGAPEPAPTEQTPAPAATPPSSTPPPPGEARPATQRTRRRPQAIVSALALILAAVVLVGVWMSATPSISAITVSTQIAQQTGLRPDQVSCPADLPAEVGASILCQANAGGPSQGLRATVTSLADGQVRFDITTQ
jgi:serine/threonine-protein kinase